MVEAGLGVSIVHSLMLKPERYHVAVLPLNVKQSREIGIAIKKGFLPSTITQLFLQHVIDYTRSIAREQRQTVIELSILGKTRLSNRRLEPNSRRFNHRAIVNPPMPPILSP